MKKIVNFVIYAAAFVIALVWPFLIIMSIRGKAAGEASLPGHSKNESLASILADQKPRAGKIIGQPGVNETERETEQKNGLPQLQFNPRTGAPLDEKQSGPPPSSSSEMARGSSGQAGQPAAPPAAQTLPAGANPMPTAPAMPGGIALTPAPPDDYKYPAQDTGTLAMGMIPGSRGYGGVMYCWGFIRNQDFDHAAMIDLHPSQVTINYASNRPGETFFVGTLEGNLGFTGASKFSVGDTRVRVAPGATVWFVARFKAPSGASSVNLSLFYSGPDANVLPADFENVPVS